MSGTTLQTIPMYNPIDFGGGMGQNLGALDWTKALGKFNGGGVTGGTGGIGGVGGTNTPGNALSTGLDWNIGTGQLALGGVQALGNMWSAFQAQDLAKKQFNFTKEFANTNLANQIKSYNSRLDDKIQSRAVAQGEAAGWADDYMNRNRLTRDTVR